MGLALGKHPLIYTPGAEEAPMQSLEAAILRTVLYAHLFRFPLSLSELHHFLIHDAPVDRPSLEAALRRLDGIGGLVEDTNGYILYRGERGLLTHRLEREALTNRLWPLAMTYGKWLARLPFTRMVALTGALSMHNPASDTDDLDYIIVTAPGRVWLARAFAIAIVRLARLRGVTVCPNYVLAETALLQERRDIFMAHEVAQMVPIYGRTVYDRFRQVNQWTHEQLPNAQGPFFGVDEYAPSGFWSMFKHGLEKLLGGRTSDWLENWEHQRKRRRFAAEMKRPYASAKLDAEQVKGHFNDHGHPVLQRYAELLRQHGLHELDEPQVPERLAGD
jgi:hypothetical protein